MSKITPRVVFVSIALVMFLWASFNILDLTVSTITNSETDLMFQMFGLAWFFSLVILVYYGAYGRIFQR